MKRGIYNKYEIRKTSGNPIDLEAKYFVLRYDKDPHAQAALYAYIESCEGENPLLAYELLKDLQNYMPCECGDCSGSPTIILYQTNGIVLYCNNRSCVAYNIKMSLQTWRWRGRIRRKSESEGING